MNDHSEETLTLAEAKTLMSCLAHAESLLLLSSPGVGKSDIVREAATEAGLECRSLLGTQIAPEDVSGVPKVIGGRTIFCPPRMLLPEDGGQRWQPSLAPSPLPHYRSAEPIYLRLRFCHLRSAN